MKRMTREEAITEGYTHDVYDLVARRNGETVYIFTELEAEMLNMLVDLRDLFFGAAFTSRATEIEELIKKARGE